MNRLSLVFWETTRCCNLECPHCRASAINSRLPDELTTSEAKRILTEIASVGKPIMVFSGGEPLVRDDLYELSSFAHNLGLKSAVATNATMITPQVGEKLKQANVSMMAVSVYGGSSSAHDSFTGEPGSYDLTMKGIENIKRAGIKFQINTTITKRNISELNAMADLATNLGASAYHVFFLVPTGRGKSLEGDSISAQEYEEVFNRLYDLQMTSELRIKATCAPHYYRVLRQRLAAENKVFPSQQSIFHQITKGCLAGQAVCFISYKGEVYGCGYLDVLAGDLRKENFKDVWQRSELFKTLRDESKLLGKCSVCEFVKICSGCRARAYAKTENYLEEEPDCLYQPIIKTKV